MINDIDKFRTSTLQIAGFAAMTPIGNIVINLPYIEASKINEGFYLYLACAILLALSGTIFIAIADYILRRESHD